MTLRRALFALLLIAAPAVTQDEFAGVDPAPTRADYFVPRLAPTRADKGADVTIVYFFDYQCPACRKLTPEVGNAFDRDHKLRVIYRDTPIFGPRSLAAARLAIASQFQGRHEAFHRALMAEKLPLTDAAIRHAASVAGIDWPRLTRDLAARSKAIDAQIKWNETLSEATGFSGTPAFIVGNRQADGALSATGLTALIADARKAHPAKSKRR
ncbi:DsbA family protein [Sphingomonas sp. ASV193]|uniref:DsbA family protein n=1 Tax=Sphingomonas sp. ASV193 TaxID=3144405 RepID=UPI0032E8FA96